MQVDTGNLVFVSVGNTDHTVSELPGIGILVRLGRDDLGIKVLGILNDRRLVNDHEVDVSRTRSLLEAARLFAF